MITIFALCTSFLLMFNSGVNVLATRQVNADQPRQGEFVSSENLMNYGGESIDYYQNGDTIYDYNVSYNSYYNGYYPEQSIFNNYVYHKTFNLDLTLNEGVDLDIYLMNSFSSETSHLDNSQLYLGSFNTFYDNMSGNTRTIRFSFLENSSRIACNLVADFEFIYYKDYRDPSSSIVNYTLNVPFYVGYGSSESLSWREWDLTTPDFSGSTGFGADYIIVDFRLRLAGTIEVSDYFNLIGYNNGYSTGYGEGYNNGYNIGHQGDTNTFRGLLGALIDTPILFLRKFFGYEVFGVNIYAALATMISLIVALSIFRIVRSIV